jgi:large subunit ribosomal protein L35Ae
MEGILVNFRGGRHTKYNNHMILKVPTLTKEKAKSLIGKLVIWTSPAKKEIKGIVKNLHGNSGCLRVIFEKGMPGQSIGSKVKIM